MSQYDKYRPTDIHWLDVIPEHWELSKAKYYFKYTTGFTPPTGQEEFYNEGITWVTIADMNKRIVEESATTLSQLAIEKYKPDLTVTGSLLYSFKLSVGKVAFAGKDLYTNEAIISILPDDAYDVRYFYYTLPQQLLQNANENIYGAKMLNQELIRNAVISFPTKDEQIAIANYLDDKTLQIDKLIANKQQLIKLLKEERTVLINNAVTLGINKDVQMRPTNIEWLENIPTHWKVKKLKHIVNEIIDTEHKTVPFYENGNYYVVRTSDIRNGILLTDKMKRTNEDGYIEWTKRAIPEVGDVLFTREAPAGEACLVPANINICLGQRMVLFKIKKDIVHPAFIVHLVYSVVVKEYINQFSQGTTVMHFNMGDIRNMPLTIPDLDEQIAILDFINTKTKVIDDTIGEIENEVQLMQEYRAALINEVVTGKQKLI